MKHAPRHLTASAFRTRPPKLALLGATMLLAATNYAHATKIAWDIAPKPLDQALNALARQSGIQILFASDIASRLHSRRLRGVFTVKEALARLLSGSGLTAKEQTANTFTVQMVESHSLPIVTIRAEREPKPPPVDHDHLPVPDNQRSNSGTKTDTRLLDLPQSLSVIPHQQYDAQGAQSINEALRYSAGISSYGSNANTDFRLTAIRGAMPSARLDGMQLPVDWRVAPYQLERIEVMRGPASVLYGAGDPGGTVYMTSKLPTATLQRELQLQLGTRAHRQLAADFSGPLDEEKNWLYRMVALSQEARLSTGPHRDRRLLFAPALSWIPNTNTRINLRAEYLHDHGNSRERYFPASGTLLPNPNGKIPRSLFTGAPDFDDYDKRQYALNYQMTHKFNDTWSMRQDIRNSHMIVDERATYATTGQYPDPQYPGTIQREMSIHRFAYRISGTDTQLQARFNTAGLSHLMLAGVEFSRFNYQYQKRYAVTPGRFDLYQPSYPPTDMRHFLSRNTEDFRQARTQLALYLQDQIGFGKHWRGTFGMRRDWTYSKADSRPFRDAETYQLKQKDFAYSVRAGLAYIAVSGLAIYMSYATSFSPMFNSVPQHVLTPTLGKQIETGIKYTPDNSKLQFSASLYEIRQRDLVTNVRDKKQDVQPGEVRMRGLELEASARFGNNLDLRASYTRQNINNLRSDEPQLVGKWPVDVPRPRQMGTLWADYRWRSGKLSGLTLGTGIRYVGQAAGDADNGLRIPAYALLDAALRYDLQHWQFSLTGSNVFDRTYVAGCENRSQCRYGDSRSVLATARYRW